MRWAALAGLLATAGCAAPPIVFDRTNLAGVQHMDVLTPGFPDGPRVAVLPPTNGALFLVINGIQEGNRSREFAQFVAAAKLDPEAGFSQALMACLGAAGVQPTARAADRRRTRPLQDYGAVGDPGANAVLDVVVTRYGYYAVVNSAPFKPTVTMQVRMVERQGRRVLMEETINMVNVAPADPGSPGASFQDYSDIAAAPDVAAHGLQAAMGEAAAAVCKRLT